MSKPLPIYSHHIFIFPFKWDILNTAKDFSERINLGLLEKQIGRQPALTVSNTSLRWERYQFDWNRDYNEAIYFHPHVRDVLFDKGQDNCTTVLQYHIPAKGKSLDYRIHLQVKDGMPPLAYTLEIEEITLNFYDSGIGFFAFHLNNYAHRNPTAVLKINDFGRRIYPQFLGADNDDRLTGPKGAFLADQIEILKDSISIVADDFRSIPARVKSKKPLQEDFLMPAHIKSLLPKTIRLAHNINMSPLLDDRMHVICWIGDKDWLDSLAKPDNNPTAAFRWYSLIFVDGDVKSGMSNSVQALEYNWKHTYKRWAEDGLYYGISRYSFVILANGDDWFHRNVVLTHMQTMYFQIVLLSLLQRGSIVRFSEEITRLSQQMASSTQLKHSTQAVKSLYSKYLEFVNKIYFREVTPQEQGIELYQMVQQNMEVERDVKALQSEIQDFFNLLDLKATEQQSDALNTLTIVGTGLLIPSIILAYYGVSAYPEISNKDDFTYLWTPFITALGMFIGLISAWVWVRGRGQPAFVRWITGIVIFFFIALLFWMVVKVPSEFK